MANRTQRLSCIIFATLYISAAGGLTGRAAAQSGPAVYAGGVIGIADLVNPNNSQTFRAESGGLYLHHTGWAGLTPEQRKRVLEIFQGAPVAVEVGFGSGNKWGQIYERYYLAYGVKPVFIAVNAYARGNQPTLEQWRTYSTELRGHGISGTTLILPTFEYQNFRPNVPTLSKNKVSSVAVFQDIIRAAGGIVLDTPPSYSMAREAVYRDWVVDAIHWTAKRRLTTVVIMSPSNSGTHWPDDTARYLQFLNRQNAIPAAFVCENDTNRAPADYPNVVGNDHVPYTALGNCGLLKQQILPNLR
jgi:hypothetical protein